MDRSATIVARNPHTNELVRHGLAHVDAGERDAILLAEALAADQIVIDENRGRREAERRGLHFTGTLSVLAAGSGHGLVDLRIAVDRLRQRVSTFRLISWTDQLAGGKKGRTLTNRPLRRNRLCCIKSL